MNDTKRKHSHHRRKYSFMNEIRSYTRKDYFDSHVGELEIQDYNMLKSMILSDIILTQKVTSKYDNICNDILNSDIIDKIVNIHKNYSIAFFRTLLLLSYKDYQIYLYYTNFIKKQEYHTLNMTVKHFNCSIEHINNLYTEFQRVFNFLKNHCNDVCFIDMIMALYGEGILYSPMTL